MTNAEIAEFVSQEIAARYKSGLNDTQRGDWMRAVWKAGDLGTARSIIRVLVDDPDASLNVKMFYRYLRARAKPQRTSALPPRYDPYIRCLEAPSGHPSWQDREWFWSEGFARSDQADKRYVTEYAAQVAAEVEAREGGRWCGVVREADDSQTPERDPQARADAEAHILDGPDGPGRRFLQKAHGGGLAASLAEALPAVPVTVQRKTVASREMINRLKQPPPALPSGPRPFDPEHEHEPELQGDLPTPAEKEMRPDDPDAY